MGALEPIEAAAQGIMTICRKERTTKTDKEKLLKLQAEIFKRIENLTECELCGAISDLIVTMTVAEVTAKLCKDCGISALEAGKIQKPATRRRSTRGRQKQATSAESEATTPEPAAAKRRTPKVEKPTGTADLYSEVEKQTKLKKTEIKRLHRIIEEIAGPMNLEHTILYVRNEAELAKLKIEDEVLSKAVELLMAA